MSAVQLQMQADAAAAINLDGEPVTYTPKGGAPASIKGLVARGTLTPRNTQSGRSLQYAITIQVPTATVNPGTVNVQGDTFSIARRIGETPRSYLLAAILHEDWATATYGLTEMN